MSKGGMGNLMKQAQMMQANLQESTRLSLQLLMLREMPVMA